MLTVGAAASTARDDEQATPHIMTKDPERRPNKHRTNPPAPAGDGKPARPLGPLTPDTAVLLPLTVSG